LEDLDTDLLVRCEHGFDEPSCEAEGQYSDACGGIWQYPGRTVAFCLEEKTATTEVDDVFRFAINIFEAGSKLLLSCDSDLASDSADTGSELEAEDDRLSFQHSEQESLGSEETLPRLKYPESDSDVQKFWEDVRRRTYSAAKHSQDAGRPMTPASSTTRTVTTSQGITTGHQSRQDHESHVSTQKSRFASPLETPSPGSRRFIIPRKFRTLSEIRAGVPYPLSKTNCAGFVQDDEGTERSNSPRNGTQTTRRFIARRHIETIAELRSRLKNTSTTSVGMTGFATKMAESQIQQDISDPLTSDMVVTPDQKGNCSVLPSITASRLVNSTGKQISVPDQHDPDSAASTAKTADCDRLPKGSWSTTPERLRSLREYWDLLKDPNFKIPLKVFKPGPAIRARSKQQQDPDRGTSAEEGLDCEV
jgi:hypothetical protein